MSKDDFWSNQRKAQLLINETNRYRRLLENLSKISIDLSNIKDELILLKDEYSLEFHNEIEKEYLLLKNEIDDLEISILLNDEFDNNNAIIEIHPGAGGTESMDWADMLYRMYVRYAERNNFKIEILDYEEGLEAGIKSVSFLIKGDNAYGYLKGEKGVHRLVRISPFDSGARRHTSFASVDVIPEINDNIDIIIKEEDLKIDTYRSSGAGGQHINKTDSAVRITHLPTGIVVSCQNQRSQIQNKEKCLETLKAKLYILQKEEQQSKLAGIRGEQKLIEWGSQIRSYVFCPYTLVKDNRTGYETSDVHGVLDGNLNEFIKSYLKLK